MEQLSTIWQAQNNLSVCVNGYEAIDMFAEPKTNGISFEMLNCSCEKAIQYSLKEQWEDENLSIINNNIEELCMLTSFYMSAVLAGLSDAGFKISTNNNAYNQNENLSYTLKNGLFKDKADGIILECANFKIIPNKNNKQESLDNFLPAIWKFKCIDNKSFTQLTKKSIVETLNATYAQLQALMAASKISHALFSCMDAKTHDIKHIWVEFDTMYYIQMMNRVERIISNTQKSLWHMPLAKDVIKLCSNCNYNNQCKKRCN